MSTSTKDTVSPYDLLGVTVNSSLQDVRKAYFELSKLCHPDKGGRPEDMHILQAAYQWILQQLQVVNERGHETVEQKEQSFKDFLASQQTRKMVSFADIIHEVSGFHLQHFDELYDRYKKTEDVITRKIIREHVLIHVHVYITRGGAPEDLLENIEKWVQQYTADAASETTYHASVPGGYGNVMDHCYPIQYTDEDSHAPIKTDFGKKELIMYKEPEVFPRELGTDVIQPKDLEDYSTDTLCDYRQAFTDSRNTLDDLLKDAIAKEAVPVDILHDQLELERKMEATSVSHEKRSVYLRFVNEVSKLKDSKT